MVADRVSLIIGASYSPASKYPQLVLVGGYPDADSLVAFFTEIPILPESGELRENSEDTPQGELRAIQLRLRIGRESSLYQDLIHQRVVLAVTTANDERHLLGTSSYPLRCDYERNSGASNSSERDTTLTFSVKMPA